MIVLDANYILRYLLDDHHDMYIESNACLVLNEVMAEVIYVLVGVYEVAKSSIAKALSDFILYLKK